MKVYLDQSIIDEYLKFKSRGVHLTRYERKATKAADIVRDLEAFPKILDLSSVTFLYSALNELECSIHRKKLFDDFFSKSNFVKVAAIGLRICMVNQELPKNHIMELGEVQSYFASHHIRKFGSKTIKGRNDLMKYMRRKFFDPMQIDSAIKAQADIFLTIDYKLLSSMERHPELRLFLGTKIGVFSPSEFLQNVTTLHNKQ